MEEVIYTLLLARNIFTNFTQYLSLEAISNKAFDPAITENAILNFKDIVYKLMNYWTKIDKNDINQKMYLYTKMH